MSLNIKIIVNYANTLFSSLNENNQHKEGLDDLNKFFAVVKKSDKLSELLSSPVTGFEKKEKALQIVFEKLLCNNYNACYTSFLCANFKKIFQ